MVNTFNIMIFWTIVNILGFFLVGVGDTSFLGQVATTDAQGNIIGAGGFQSQCANSSGGNIPCDAVNDQTASGSTVIRFDNVVATIWNFLKFIMVFSMMPVVMLQNIFGLPQIIAWVIGVPMMIMYISGWVMIIRGAVS